MRILTVNAYAHITGGGDTVCFGLMKALGELGHDVALVATESDRNTMPTIASVPLTVSSRTKNSLHGRQAATAALKAVWNRGAARATQSAVTEFAPDLVHVHKLYPQLSCAPVVTASRLGLPVVQSVHDYEFIAADPTDARGRPIDMGDAVLPHRVVNTATYAARRIAHAPRVTEWIANSAFVAAQYAKRGISCTTVPLFTDVPALPRKPVSARRGVLFVGRLSEEKGLRDFLALQARCPEIEFRVFGSGPLENELTVAAGRERNLAYPGWLEQGQVREAVRSARLVVMPSHWEEPAGLVALEAMSEGTPVVAYDAGGLGGLVKSNNGGITVPIGDFDRLLGAVQELSTKDKLWDEHSVSGSESVARNHTRTAYAKQVLEVYRNALDYRQPKGIR